MLELELDIVLKDTGQMDYVKFPHKQHSQWLACSNCHTELFPYKSGVVKIRMDDVLNGKYCGMCHGKVSFSPMLCERCHSVPKQPLEKIAE
jgi:c(7)-type cytochrome triheme protein